MVWAVIAFTFVIVRLYVAMDPVLPSSLRKKR